jgi:hypothetical protein
MNPRGLRNYPELINEEGLKNIWRAVIKQAVEDLDKGGLPVKGHESANMKVGRQLDAYHWLMTERSDIAFRAMGVDGDAFRDEIRTRLKSLGFEMPQEPVTNIKMAA